MIPVAQLIIAVVIIVLIVLQERQAGLSGLFGGDSGGGVYQTRRGFEKAIFAATIVFSVIFIALAVAQLLLS
ncbi:MAG: preprotein translocase subunit SecG [bacterium]|nr:preprotein translocase subunit SecG [bacterium]